MVSPLTSSVIRAPGIVVANPTDLTDPDGDQTYGGVILGKTRAVALVGLASTYGVECEGLGEYSDILEAGNRYVVNLFLRGWDKDAVEQTLAGGYALGATTGRPVWTEPGVKTAGESTLGRARVFLFAPEDTTFHPAMLIRRGVPDFAEGAEFAFQRDEELGLNMTIACMRSGADKILDVGMLEDLTL